MLLWALRQVAMILRPVVGRAEREWPSDADPFERARTRRLEPTHKQHTAVCAKAGVIVDVEVTRASETKAVSLCPLLQEPRR